MADVIFYGAGHEAREKLHEWIDKGLTPVCFADADVNKHYTRFIPNGAADPAADGYDILPLAIAMERYPDTPVAIAVAFETVDIIKDYLLRSGLAESQIIIPDLEEYLCFARANMRVDNMNPTDDLFQVCDELTAQLGLNENRLALIGSSALGDAYLQASRLTIAQKLTGKQIVVTYDTEPQRELWSWFCTDHSFEMREITKRQRRAILASYRPALRKYCPFIIVCLISQEFEQTIFNYSNVLDAHYRAAPVMPRQRDEALIEKYGIAPGKTMLIIPESNCIKPYPDYFWSMCASIFGAIGYKVLINTQKSTIEGEKIFPHLSEIKQLADLCGNVFAMRTGLIDVISTTTANMAIISTKSFPPIDELYEIANDDNRIRTFYMEEYDAAMRHSPFISHIARHFEGRQSDAGSIQRSVAELLAAALNLESSDYIEAPEYEIYNYFPVANTVRSYCRKSNEGFYPIKYCFRREHGRALLVIEEFDFTEYRLDAEIFVDGRSVLSVDDWRSRVIVYDLCGADKFNITLIITCLRTCNKESITI